MTIISLANRLKKLEVERNPPKFHVLRRKLSETDQAAFDRYPHEIKPQDDYAIIIEFAGEPLPTEEE